MQNVGSGLTVIVPRRTPDAWWKDDSYADAVLELSDLKYGFPVIRAEFHPVISDTQYSVIIGVPFSIDETNVMAVIKNLYFEQTYLCDDVVNTRIVSAAVIAVLERVRDSGLLGKLKAKISEECEKIINVAKVSVEDVRFFPVFDGLSFTNRRGNPIGIVMKHKKYNISATFMTNGKILVESSDGKLCPDSHMLPAVWQLMLDIAASKSASSTIENL